MNRLLYQSVLVGLSFLGMSAPCIAAELPAGAPMPAGAQLRAAFVPDQDKLHDMLKDRYKSVITKLHTAEIDPQTGHPIPIQAAILSNRERGSLVVSLHTPPSNRDLTYEEFQLMRNHPDDPDVQDAVEQRKKLNRFAEAQSHYFALFDKGTINPRDVPQPERAHELHARMTQRMPDIMPGTPTAFEPVVFGLPEPEAE